MAELPEVSLRISWEDLFGKKASDITDQERRNRFSQWIDLSDEDENPYWTDISGCINEETREACHCLDGYWCVMMGLPCTVNPFLTMCHGMLGMACMGCPPEKGEPIQTAIW